MKKIKMLAGMLAITMGLRSRRLRQWPGKTQTAKTRLSIRFQGVVLTGSGSGSLPPEIRIIGQRYGPGPCILLFPEPYIPDLHFLKFITIHRGGTHVPLRFPYMAFRIVRPGSLFCSIDNNVDIFEKAGLLSFYTLFGLKNMIYSFPEMGSFA